MVTCMIVWMRRHARDLRSGLECARAARRAGQRVGLGAGRHGVPRGAAARASRPRSSCSRRSRASRTRSAPPLGAACSASRLAAVIGYGIYRGGVRINLQPLLHPSPASCWSLVAAGLLMTAAHTAHEARLARHRPGHGARPAAGWSAPARRRPRCSPACSASSRSPTVVEVVVWLLYVVPMLAVVLLARRRRAAHAGAPRPPRPAPDPRRAPSSRTGRDCACPRPSPRRALAPAPRRAAALAVAACRGTLTAACGPTRRAPTRPAAPAPRRSPSSSPTTAAPPRRRPCRRGPDRPSRSRNAGAGAVTEAEVMQDGRILGEKENLTPGLPAASRCASSRARTPSTARTRDDRAVDARRSPPRPPRRADDARRRPSSRPPAAAYRALRRRSQAAQLASARPAFAAAVQGRRPRRGQGAVRARPAPLRDASSRSPRASATSTRRSTPASNDVDGGPQWTGFHRIEKALWEDGTTDGMAPYADKLLADVTGAAGPGPDRGAASRRRSPTARSSCSTRSPTARSPARRTATRTPTCGTSRPTSPASEAAFDAAAPALQPESTPRCRPRSTDQFAAVRDALDQYRDRRTASSPTPSRHRRPAPRPSTSQVNALAEPLSKVAPPSPERDCTTVDVRRGTQVVMPGRQSRRRRSLGGARCSRGVGAAVGAVGAATRRQDAVAGPGAGARAGWSPSTARTRPASRPRRRTGWRSPASTCAPPTAASCATCCGSGPPPRPR